MVTQKVAQISEKLQQTDTKKSGGFRNMLLFLLLLGMPFFAANISLLSIDIAKKPMDATTHPKVKEVHDRHLVGIIVLYAIYNAFLVICYGLSEKLLKLKFFMIIFVVINFAFGFVMMVIAADATQKLKEGNKEAEYKKYLKMLAIMIGFSVVLMVAMGFWFVVLLFGKS